MPLKAIVRGHSYAAIPTGWTNRTSGVAKLAMKEMGSRYLFIVLCLWLENVLSRGGLPGPAVDLQEPLTFPAKTPLDCFLGMGIGEFSGWLQARRPEVEEIFLARVHGISDPSLVQDAEYLEATRRRPAESHRSWP